MNSLNKINKTYLPFSIPCFVKQYHKIRSMSSLRKATAALDEDICRSIENNKIKPRKHPGVLPRGPFTLPSNVKNSINKLLKDVSRKELLEEAKQFRKFLLARDVPSERHSVLLKTRQIEAEVEKSMNVETEKLSEEELKHYEEIKNIRVKELLKQRVYHWNRLDFTDYLCLVYLVTRSAAEYAAVSKVFAEISARTSFQPKTVFDFGSGVGSVVWAANCLWGNSISEYYCVDSSSHMIDLSERIMKECYSEKITRRIFHRQFLPSSNEISSDIVVSAYSLLELPSRLSRLETVKNLWAKTAKYLVLIEFGTSSGFKVLNEARDYLLSEECNNESENNEIHVFAPCPHDLACPRAEAAKNICYFPVLFSSFPQKPEAIRSERFSYVVFEKGLRKSSYTDWPRIVQPVLSRSRHTICRFCTNSGSLKEVIFSPSKHGKVTYKCARSSRWGDLFPCSLKENEIQKELNESESS